MLSHHFYLRMTFLNAVKAGIILFDRQLNINLNNTCEIKFHWMIIKPGFVLIKVCLINNKSGWMKDKCNLIRIKRHLLRVKETFTGIKVNLMDNKWDLLRIKPDFMSIKLPLISFIVHRKWKNRPKTPFYGLL